MKKPISEFMTPTPHTIGAEQPLSVAEELMKKYAIRHLPVLKGGSLLGVVSDRDISWIKSLAGLNLNGLQVSDAMSQEPYVVTPETELQAVTREMGKRHLGSAIVLDGNKCVGIFTAVDACRVLGEIAL